MVLAKEVLVTLNFACEVEIADVAVEVGVVARTLKRKSMTWGCYSWNIYFTGLGFGFFSDETSFCGTTLVVFPDQLTKNALTPLS